MDQLQDMLYSIRDTALEAWDGIQDQFPFLSEIPRHKVVVVSGAAILLSLVCVLKTLGNAQTATALEDEAAKYQAGQVQLNSVLGDAVDIGLDDEAKNIIGVANLTLQYKDLTTMPSDSGISTMKKNLGIGDSQTSSENEEYNAEMSDKIKDFAGNYGGALVVPGTIGTSSLKVAAYNSTASMKAPDDSSVSNVLYEKIRRTIESDEYGVADTQDNVIFLSAAKIKGISSVQVGSSLYTLFGDEDSAGSKETNKYVCTGVAEGTYVMDEEESDEEETSSSSSSDDSDTAEDVDVSEENTSGDEAEAPVVETDASQTIITSDDVVEGESSYNSDGTVNEEWAEANEDTETVTSGTSEEDDDTDAEDADDDGYSDDGLPTTSKYSVAAAQVLDENGKVLTENKTADLILYQYSRRTGKVKITYWNLSGSDAANKALTNETKSMVTTDDAAAMASTEEN